MTNEEKAAAYDALLDRYVALLERHNALIEQRLNARKKLTAEERQQIFDLHAQGIDIHEIARRMKRSVGGVSNVIKYGNSSGRIIKKD